MTTNSKLRLFTLRLFGLFLLGLFGLATPSLGQVTPVAPITSPIAAPAPIVVTGRIADSATKQALPFAAAALFTEKDSIIASGQAADDGRFTLPAVPAGRYRLQVSYVGYAPYKRFIKLNGPYDLGTVQLGQAAQELEEVEVIGRIPPTRQRGDTTEFNAAAFKVNRDATTEDLVGKMPGLSTDGGQLKALGETVTQVTVDGKPFFGDDPTQAVRNLPADMVDKVQLLDQRSETSRLTGFDDGNRQKTLNIVTKANKRKGVFGKASASAGTEGKYAASAVANVFNGNRRVTALAQSNNINQQNFQMQDLAGVMGGGGGNRGGGGGGGNQGGGAGSNGGGGRGGPGPIGNFLVGQQSGINTTTAAGANYSDVIAKNLEVNGSYFFNQTRNASDQTTQRNYISQNPDSAQHFRELGRDRSVNLNHRINARLEWKPDTNNTLIFRPRLSTQHNDLNSSTLDTTTRGTRLQSILANNYRTLTNGLTGNGELVLRHRFAKMGRSIVLNLNGSAQNQDGITDRRTQTSTLQTLEQPDSTRQRITNSSTNYAAGAGITYTEPVAAHSQLLFAYEPQAQFRSSDRQTDTAGRGGIYTPNYALTNQLTSRYLTQQGGVGLRYALGKWRAGGQVNYQRADLTIHQSLLARSYDTSRAFTAFLPQVNANYKISTFNNISLNANTSTSPPSASQLQRVANTSNALQFSTGNPSLRQTYTASGNLNYTHTSATAGKLFTLFGYGSLVDDYIGNTTLIARHDTTIDAVILPAGGQLTRPANLGQQYTGRAFALYGTPLPGIKSNLNLNLNYGYTSTPGSVNGRVNRSASNAFGGGATLSSNISERVDFTLNSNSTYSHVVNTVQQASNYNYFSQSNSLRLTVLFPAGINFTSTITHTCYNGLSQGYNQNYLLWNATLGKKLGRDKQWEVQVIAYDILKQNNSIARTISDVYVQDTRTNVLRQYVMLGVTYTLRRFKGTPTEEPKRNFNGPPGGFGPGGPLGGPGGGPPGGGF